MLDVLQFYVSGFWIWLGITIGIGIVVKGIIITVVGGAAAIRGSSVHVGDVTNKTEWTE
jgi:hypothetical protein